jgi:hypothetical protein
MMDNLVVMILILTAISLLRGKYALSGFLIGLNISLKLYPILFFPVAIIYLIKKERSIGKIFPLLIALTIAIFLTIALPFTLLRWNVDGLLGVLTSQATRTPGGIAPLGILSYLDLENMGLLSVATLSDNWMFRLLWVPGIAIMTLILSRHRLSTFSDVINGLILTYSSYLLLAPWVSEQNVETLIVLLLFADRSKTLNTSKHLPYFAGSFIVFAFTSLHVPITSFLYPVLAIDPEPMAKFAHPILPWLVLTFAAYLLILMWAMLRKVT